MRSFFRTKPRPGRIEEHYYIVSCVCVYTWCHCKWVFCFFCAPARYRPIMVLCQTDAVRWKVIRVICEYNSAYIFIWRICIYMAKTHRWWGRQTYVYDFFSLSNGSSLGNILVCNGKTAIHHIIWTIILISIWNSFSIVSWGMWANVRVGRIGCRCWIWILCGQK